MVGEVELEDEKGKRVFYTNSEADGFPCFIKSKKSVMETLLDNSDENDDAVIQLTNNADSMEYFELTEMRKSTKYYIYQYLTHLVVSNIEESDRFMKETVGKYLDEIEIPEYKEEDE